MGRLRRLSKTIRWINLYNSLRPMTSLLRCAVWAGLAAATCGAQPSAELLARLDRFARTFHGIKAAMRTTNHVAGINEDEVQSGTIVLRRDSQSKFRMLISVTGENASTVVLREQIAEIYHPKLNEIQEWDIRQFKDIAQQLFQLGFGVAGSQLAKDYNLTTVRREAVNGENTTYVELAPKSAEVLKRLSKVELWISEKTDCAIRQKLYFPDGGYRLVEYSDLLVNPFIEASAFDLPKGAKRVRVN